MCNQQYISQQQAKITSQFYDEDQLDCLVHLHLPLEEQHPDEFRRYLQLFYDFWPKRPFNTRIAYDRGFIQKNRKYKDGRGTYPAYCHPALVARHLDPGHWQFLHPDLTPTERFWLAMWAPKKSMLKVLDIDNKQNRLGYTQAREGPLMPVVHIPLEHFIELKRIYDEFPGHIWCISSETLGLHVWEKYPRPVSVQDIHRTTRPRLKKIGIACEIHPMFGRCFRRPFGQDYATITENGILTNWIEQLNYFDGDARPSFTAIYSALRGRLLAQWGMYNHWGGPSQIRFRQTKRIDTAPLRRELEEIDAWAEKGFPCQEPVFTVKEPSSPTGTKAKPTVSHCDTTLSDVCNQDWVQNCEAWARKGLPSEDSLFLVVSQLARWLYFVELFSLPKDQRLETIKNTLVHFCLTKHNGFISRLGAGLEQEVSEHIHRAVDSGINNADTAFKEYCAIMRQKREKGQYRRIIWLEPLLLGQSERSNTLPLVGFYKCGVSGTPKDQPILDDPLPSSILAKLMEVATAKQPDKNGRLITTMRKRNGEYPFVRFSRRFLNVIWAEGGEANLHFLYLNKMLDMKPGDED